MKVLLIAPHPFFTERGTPIDVLLVLRVLSQRPNTEIDVLTLHEGRDVTLPNVRITRIPTPPGVHRVRPGFSLKKVVCFFYLMRAARRMARRTRYDLVHAGEEAVFIAMLLGMWTGIPYAYDLDSSVAQQLIEQMPYLLPLRPLFSALEARAIRGSLICLPVCNALAALCERHGARKVVTLHDISQLEHPCAPATGFLKKELGVQGTLFLYVGNLEPYQGIDLLLAAFRHAASQRPDLFLAIIGGPSRQAHYEHQARHLGLDGRVFFLGPRPFDALDRHLAEADVLVCPRIRGLNTPMKIFAFLDAGRPVLATDLPTHSQILTPQVAMLAPPTPAAFGAAMIRLTADPAQCRRLAEAGHAFVAANHTFDAHQRRLNAAYDWVDAQLQDAPGTGAPAVAPEGGASVT